MLKPSGILLSFVCFPREIRPFLIETVNNSRVRSWRFISPIPSVI